MHHRYIILFGIISYALTKTYTDFTVYESLSVALFIYYLFYFLENLGKKLVILDVIVLSAILTCLLLPLVGYHYFDATNKLSRVWVKFMRVPTDEYYSFVFPCTIAMIAGLKMPVFFNSHIYANHEQYIINVKSYLKNTKWQGVTMVAIGLFASVMQNYVPALLSHIFFLLKYLMFVGAFYCLYSDFPNKRIILFSVFAILVVRSITAGMFGELVFMGAMAIIILMLGKKLNFNIKLVVMLLGIYAIAVLQLVKPAYRLQTWKKGFDQNKFTIFTDIVMEKVKDPMTIFDDEKILFAMYTRFNQGQIISSVINSVPERYPYANGETIYTALAASLVPRFLWPDKPEAGGVYNFKRFLGISLRGWSANISPYGEAWGNFGRTGGIVFMFLFGLMFNFIFHWLLKITMKVPSLILWFPYLFFYAVSIETDVLSMLNSITKSAILAYLIYWAYPKFLKQKI